MDLLLVRKRGIKDICLLGDSLFVIYLLRTNSFPRDNGLNLLIRRIKGIMSSFPALQPFHILRSLNEEVDQMANKACLLEEGIIDINGEVKNIRTPS